MRILRITALLALAILTSNSTCKHDQLQTSKNVRLIYWNIQDGMWDGQDDNYDRFVEWVKAKDPDICVWCEAQSHVETGSEKNLPQEKRYLVDNWGELAARYGHAYWGIGGHRDNYPQVITSKYPITYVDKIVGEESDVIVSHGAGWATVEVGGKPVNIVTLHLWPQAFAYGTKDRDASRAENGGDKYREEEVRYICEHTIGTTPGSEDEFWLMLGDFNSKSRVDNATYNLADNSSQFLVHDYISHNTPYLDVIHEKYPYTFKPSTGSKTSRIDFVYCTKALYNHITFADIVWDDYTTPVKVKGLRYLWSPSDHLPILVDFKID